MCPPPVPPPGNPRIKICTPFPVISILKPRMERVSAGGWQMWLPPWLPPTPPRAGAAGLRNLFN